MKTLEQINKEYGQACAELGQAVHRLEYEVPLYKKGLEELIAKVKDKIVGLKEEHSEVSKGGDQPALGQVDPLK